MPQAHDFLTLISSLVSSVIQGELFYWNTTKKNVYNNKKNCCNNICVIAI